MYIARPRRLTPPSSGRATAGFACRVTPLMSNVSHHMKHSVASASLLFIAFHSTASELNLCEPFEQTVFSCRLQNNKIASVCAGNDPKTKSPTVQYRFGKSGKVPELIFPAIAANGPKRMSYTSFGDIKWESRNLLFAVGEYSYMISSFSVMFDEPEASITVRRGGTSCTVLVCRPGFVDDLPTLGQMQLREAPRKAVEQRCRGG